MKVILYMATTANGFIATKEDEVDFVSDDSWESYVEQVKDSNVIVIGRRTYEVMPEDEFEKNTQYYVFTNKKDLEKKVSNMKFINTTTEFLDEIKDKEGKVAICGGSQINSLFLKENLIDEIILDIEPHIFGSGIPLFSEVDFQIKLKLLNTKKLSDNTMQLHYKVEK